MFKTNKVVEKSEQTIVDKMHVLTGEAYIRLGRRWQLYQKIRKSDEGLAFLKQKSMFEQMKATRSALQYTEKTVKKLLKNQFQASTRDVKKYMGKEVEIPELIENEGELPVLTPECDGFMVQWTPLKFLIPSGEIRDKGKATLRHTEGLIAKFFFKVVGYYTIPENWDSEKLALYLKKIDNSSSYKDISDALKPLKDDLSKFNSVYQLFKFGKISKHESSGNADAFDDMIQETDEESVQTLYWHTFIYRGMELFLFRYYLTLLAACKNVTAMRQLSMMFEPVLSKSIEIRHVFLGTLEIDRQKRKLRQTLEDFTQKQAELPSLRTIKIRQGRFESYNYTLALLEKTAIHFETIDTQNEDSPWAKFVQEQLIDPWKNRSEDSFEDISADSDEEDDDFVPELDPFKRTEAILLEIMSMLIKSTQFRVEARKKVFARFKEGIQTDKDTALNYIKQLKKLAEKKVRDKQKKIQKFKRLEQTDTVELLENDLEKFKKDAEKQYRTIEHDTKLTLLKNKERMQKLLDSIKQESSVQSGYSSKIILHLMSQLIPDEQYSRKFTKFLIEQVTGDFVEDMVPFYENMFFILEPTTQEKVALIQAVQKSPAGSSLKLKLDDSEKEQFDSTINQLKNKLNAGVPGIFKRKIMLGALNPTIEDLLKANIDNKSLGLMLKLKASEPNKAPSVIPPGVAKSLLMINSIMNPVPTNNLIIEGRENEKQPEKAINTTLLRAITD